MCLNHYHPPHDEIEALFGEGNSCSLFIRDPRDLNVSGYYYHRKGVERWTKIKNPAPSDYVVVNGCIPNAVRDSGLSLSELVSQCDLPQGLLIELEFRQNHFRALSSWLSEPVEDLPIMSYNDIVGNEVKL